MLNPNHKNKACGFAEEIVSYLYGEIVDAEKQKFEAHLKNCEPCTDELAEFSGVRFAFSKLKNEFSLIKIPIIEIPYENQREVVEVSSVNGSWFDGIRTFLANISVWQTATGFAVLMVLAVFSIFLLRSNNNDEIVANVKNSPKPTVKKTESNPVVNPQKSSETVAVNEEKNPVENQSDEVKTSNDELKPKSAVKVNERPQPKAKNNNGNKETAPKNENLKNNNRNNRNNLPRLNDVEDTEDDSLRLADLFDEIDTTED